MGVTRIVPPSACWLRLASPEPLVGHDQIHPPPSRRSRARHYIPEQVWPPALIAESDGDRCSPPTPLQPARDHGGGGDGVVARRAWSSVHPDTSRTSRGRSSPTVPAPDARRL